MGHQKGSKRLKTEWLPKQQARIIRDNNTFDAERAIPLRVIAILFTLLGILILFACDQVRNIDLRFQMQLTGIALLMITLGAWQIDSWNTLLARWILVAELLAGIVIGDAVMAIPGILAYAAMPVIVATALVTPLAGLLASLLSAAVVLALSRLAPVVAGRPPIALVIGAICVVQIVMLAISWQMQRLSQWVQQHYRMGRDMLQEAQTQRARLHQVLDDLADANIQLQRLNAVAQGMRETAEEALATKARFVANVSHELRTPLNMITGFCEMITQAPETYGDLPSALLADLAVIHRNSEHLSSLIDDVLDLSQIEQGEMALSKERACFGEIVDAAVVAVRPLFAAKGLYLRTDIPADLPSLFGDRTRIREVVLNLLSNAGRFTERGGVTIKVRSRDGGIVTSIADTGPGISEEHLERIFEPFHQADGSIRRRYGGSGLGLSISKQFIELHDGTIWVESERNKGTTFHFRLPIAPGVVPGAGGWSRWVSPQWEYVQRTAPSAAPPIRPRPRYAVVEKSGGLARLLGRYLQDAEIQVFSELETALAEIARSPAEVLVLNDMAVGQALQRLRTADLPHSLPAIVCSVPGPQEAASKLGVSDYLVKPISREKLLTTLDRLELEGNTILIVDDQPEALRLFRRMLSSSGKQYRVLRARDGEEGLHMLREQRPNAVLLDLVMPRLDGFKLLEAKSQDLEIAAIPVVVISARDPMGQPIVSGAMAITRGGGLSTHHLLAAIEAMTQFLSPTAQSGDPVLQVGQRD